jgi:glycine/D-amino acid oxidase-like deaminating enzyme
MNRKLDLRTGRPVWFAYRAPAVPTQTLTRDVKTDVLIVGMGISGAMIAQAVAASGRSVVCVDRRGPLEGSTSATTALVQFEVDQPLTTLVSKIGKAKAEQAWRRSKLAVANLGARIEELAIKCSPSPKPSLYLAGNVLGPTALREEAQARRAAGIHSTYLTKAALQNAFSIDRDGAILSRDNLALDPRKLAAGLFLSALEAKARYYAPVEIAGMETSRENVVAASTHGPTITAKHVVLATGYELTDIVPAARHQIISTWAIATKPQKNSLWRDQAFVWEASDPYLYMRATYDGRVICGGEDEEFSDEDSRDQLIGAKSARIAAKLKALFPQLDTEPAFTWAGSFGTTSTGLPYIGAIPQHPRIFAVMGYGGNGITYSQIASEIIVSALEGASDTDASLFAFDH